MKGAISKTIKREIDDRVPEVIKFIDQPSKRFAAEHLNFKAGSPSVELSDLAFFESFFLDRKGEHTIGSTEREIIEDVEFALVVRLAEDRQNTKSLENEDFSLHASKEFIKITLRIKVKFAKELKKYHTLYDQADPSTRKKLEDDPRMKKHRGKNPEISTFYARLRRIRKVPGKNAYWQPPTVPTF